jgi:hypothetical protein
VRGVAFLVQGLAAQTELAGVSDACAALQDTLVRITGLAAFNSLVVGELPRVARPAAEDLVAEVGLLGRILDYAGVSGELGEQYGWGQEASDSEADGSGAERRFLVAQQLRLSNQEMGIYEDHTKAAEEADEDFEGNFS